MPELSCADCMDLSGEVALGVADAQERADVLLHVEDCPACSARLRSMTEVADGLAELLPPSDPPAGFDARVVDAILRPPPVRSRLTFLERVRTRPVAAVAAVVVAVAVGVGGWLIGETTSLPTSPVVTASLRVERTNVGQVVVSGGEHPWISMAVHVHRAKTVVRCEVRNKDGAVTTIGSFTIVHGYGYWAASLPYGLVVRSAELVTPDGHVLASAMLGTS